jgi:CHASE3 domain sensor protein
MNILDAFHATVHDADGGCEVVALRLGMNPGVLRNKANPNIATNKPTLEEADRLMGLTGDHRILQSLARNHGYVCIKMDEVENASDVAVLELVVKVMRTQGDVGKEMYDALADGRITQAELARVQKAVKEAECALEQLSARVAGMAEPR